MVLLPLVPGVRSSSNTGNFSFKGTPPKVMSEKVLRRDDYTCRFCGFRSLKFQRVIPHKDAGDPPLATACTFCEQYLYLDRSGITGSGLLIWLPELGQAELNHLARAAYIARAQKATHETMATLATRVVDVLTARRAEAKKRLGSDDPLLLATIFHESLTDDERVNATQKLDGIRLLPSEKHWMRGNSGDVNQFPLMVKYWQSSEGPYAKLPLETWAVLFKSVPAKTGNA